jgi:tyrosyl-tRNA synthetase
MSEGRRVVVQGAVKVNGETITDLAQTFDFKESDIITIGKRLEITVGDLVKGDEK